MKQSHRAAKQTEQRWQRLRHVVTVQRKRANIRKHAMRAESAKQLWFAYRVIFRVIGGAARRRQSQRANLQVKKTFTVETFTALWISYVEASC
jgi:hypothetical protein